MTRFALPSLRGSEPGSQRVTKTETPKIEAPAVKQPYKAKTESKVAAEAQSILDHKAQLKKANIAQIRNG